MRVRRLLTVLPLTVALPLAGCLEARTVGGFGCTGRACAVNFQGSR